MSTNRFYIALISTLVLILAAGALLYVRTSPPAAQPALQETPQTGTVSLTIQGVYASKIVPTAPGDTVLHVLEKLTTEDADLQLATKEYAGLGTLVESMHGQKNGTDQKYWQYEVNGVMPQIGADKYTLTHGDVVEWYFGTSQEQE